MNIGGNLGKITSEMMKQTKENEKVAKALQKELTSAKLPSNTMKNMDKFFKQQFGIMGQMAKSLDQTQKVAKEAEKQDAKGDGGADLQLLKDLERSIAQQGEIVKKLIKNASK